MIKKTAISVVIHLLETCLKLLKMIADDTVDDIKYPYTPYVPYVPPKDNEVVAVYYGVQVVGETYTDDTTEWYSTTNIGAAETVTFLSGEEDSEV